MTVEAAAPSFLAAPQHNPSAHKGLDMGDPSKYFPFGFSHLVPSGKFIGIFSFLGGSSSPGIGLPWTSRAATLIE